MFSTIRSLFRKREEPQKVVAVPLLGEMEWSHDDEAWVGNAQGFRFSLGYDGQATPSESLVGYARDILSDAQWLTSTFAEAKAEAIRSYEGYYEEEIRSLSFESIHFYDFKGANRILADLEPGREDRCWRIEYADRRCEGIGFDD